MPPLRGRAMRRLRLRLESTAARDFSFRYRSLPNTRGLKMRKRWAVVASLVLVLAIPGRGAPAEIDATAYYRSALAAMQSVVEPPYLTYRTTVPASDGTILISRGDDGRAELAVAAGESELQSWNVAYRDADGLASLTLANGERVISQLAAFDPTWRGAFTWLRRGFGAALPGATPPPATTAPSPTPAESAPPLLAIVRAINENAYDIRDGGETACGDGRPARVLWTTARSDALEHPMTRAVVDVQSRRFCGLRFHERLPSPAVTFDLDIDLQMGPVGRYYLITGGNVSGAVRPYRRPGWFRMDTAFRYDRFAF